MNIYFDIKERACRRHCEFVMKEIYFFFFCVSFKYCENCDMKEATQKINQMLLVDTLHGTRSLYAKNNENLEIFRQTRTE